MEKQQLIDALNGDLAAEYSAIVQYIQYSAKVKGPWRTELRGFFQGEIPDEQRHAQFLADKIAALGGNPTLQADAVPEANSPEEMLRAVCAAESEAIRRYTERAEQADELGEIGLKVELENFIADEQKHFQEVQQILAGWK
jgi:bacterioferritin